MSWHGTSVSFGRAKGENQKASPSPRKRVCEEEMKPNQLLAKSKRIFHFCITGHILLWHSPASPPASVSPFGKRGSACSDKHQEAASLRTSVGSTYPSLGALCWQPLFPGAQQNPAEMGRGTWIFLSFRRRIIRCTDRAAEGHHLSQAVLVFTRVILAMYTASAVH